MKFLQAKRFSYFKTFHSDPRFEVIDSADGLQRVENHLYGSKTIAWDYETDGLKWFKGDKPCGVAFSAKDGDKLKSYYIPYRHITNFPQIQVDHAHALQRKILGDPNKLVLAHNGKFDLHMAHADGLEVAGTIWDTIIMATLYQEDQPRGLKDRAVKDLGDPSADANAKTLAMEVSQLAAGRGLKKQEYMEEFGYSEVDLYLCGTYAAQDTNLTYSLYEFYMREGMYDLFGKSPLGPDYPSIWETEMGLLRVITRMEEVGIPIDVELLHRVHQHQLEKKETIEKYFFAETKLKRFNFGSDDQLRDVLTKHFKLPLVDKTPPSRGKSDGDYKVDAHTLKNFVGVCPQLGHIIKWKEADHIVTSGTLSLLPFIDENDILHGEFNQYATNTGRFSCLHGDSLVTTPDGDKPIRDIVAGDLVWTHKNRWREVASQWKVGDRQTYDVYLSNGKILTCTGNHQLLMSDGRWITVEDLYYGGEQEICREFGECREDLGHVSGDQPLSYIGPNSGEDGMFLSFCSGYRVQAYTQGPIQSAEGYSVLSIQGGGQEPNARCERGEPSQLAGGLRRREGVQDQVEGWETPVLSPDCDGGSSRGGSYSLRANSASYRWESKQQRVGQFGVMHNQGAPSYPRLAGKGHTECRVEKINVRGSAEVFDIEVTEDHSYLSEGVFSHNSKNPNCQNIGSYKGDLLDRVKPFFVVQRKESDPFRKQLVSRGYSGKTKRVYVDFSQVELRILAHYSQDKKLLQTYRDGGDIHDAVERSVFGTGKSVDPETGDVIDGPNRRKSKTINFGINYGLTPEGFARRITEVTVDEAREFYRKHGEEFPGIEQLRVRLVNHMLMNGGAFTNMFGRRRQIPIILSQEGRDQRRGARQAIGSLIQGTSADVTKISMWLTWKEFRKRGLSSELVQTIHDENVTDCPEEEFEEVCRIKREIMENFPCFSVPITVDSEYSETNWDEKHTVKFTS